MKLFIDQEQGRPEYLTPSFFSTFMVTQTKKQAILQLISFKKKRELVYSTKVSDGYFQIKVMVVQEAAKQIDQGSLKNFSIINSWVRNHGDGVIVIKEKIRYWECKSIIGQPIPWRLKKQNINAFGSNIIVWNSQQLMQIHAEQTQIIIQKHELKAGSNKQQKQCMMDQQSKRQDISSIANSKLNSRSLQSLTQTQSINIAEKNNRVGSTQLQSILTEQKQSISERQPDTDDNQFVKKLQSKDSKQSKRSRDILQFIFAQDQQDQRTADTNFGLQKKDISVQNKSKHSGKIEKQVVNLKMIFDCLNEQQQQYIIIKKQKKYNQQQKEAQLQKEDIIFQKQHIKIQNIDSKCKRIQTKFQKGLVEQNRHMQLQTDNNNQDSDSSQEGFLQWLQIKKNNNINNSLKKKSISKHSSTKKRQMYKYLMSSSQSDNQLQKSPTKIECVVKCQSPNKLVQNNQPQQLKNWIQIKFQDIYHGIFTKKSSNWCVNLIIRCIGNVSPKDYVNGIVSDTNYQYLMNITLSNFSLLQIRIQQGRLYKMGNGIIKPTNDLNCWNGSHTEIQFDCSKCFITEVEEYEQPKCFDERSSNYQPLSKLYDLSDGQLLNTYGILKQINIIKTKNSMIANFNIVDPIIRYGITLTQFDSKINSQDIDSLINRPITIYNACSGSFRGKKNIVTRSKTIIKHEFLPLTKECCLIWEWIQNSSNSIFHVDLNLVGYAECLSLDRISSIPGSCIFLKNVTILDINDKYSYLSCTTCYKKVQDNRCRSCGKRNLGQAVERLFVRGNIGDQTSVLGVMWSKALAESVIQDGFIAFKQRWLLKKVAVWLERGSNQNMTIIKMQEQSSKERLKKIFEFINEGML